MTLDDAAAICHPAKLATPPTPEAAAQAILREMAGSVHTKIANMLRVCADALPMHDDPIGLCARNSERLMLSLTNSDPRWPEGLTATDVNLAAGAFANAAKALAE